MNLMSIVHGKRHVMLTTALMQRGTVGAGAVLGAELGAVLGAAVLSAAALLGVRAIVGAARRLGCRSLVEATL